MGFTKPDFPDVDPDEFLAKPLMERMRPQRSAGNVHPVWSYAHVPNGYTGDATAVTIAQIERFAPGFRDASSVTPCAPPPKWPPTTRISWAATL
jgi:hypothetical protein